MTAPHAPTPTDSLPVASAILGILSAFSQAAALVFEDLSRPTHQHAPTHPPSGAIRALETCAALDEQLGALLHRAEAHVRNENRIRALERELVQHELRWRAEVELLQQERTELKTLVDSGRKDRASIEQAGKAALTPETILSYARLLAPYTSAPPRHQYRTSDPSKPAGDPSHLPGAILPYPTEEVMRRGRLAFADAADIGETSALTGAKPEDQRGDPLGGARGAGAGGSKAAQPVPAARRPAAALQDEDDDFAFDLDLNPDL